MLPKSSFRVVAVLWTAVAAVAGCSEARQGDQPESVPQSQVDLEGDYACVGHNVGGAQYEGTTRITKQGDAWYLLWQIGLIERHEGIGILSGQTLAVSWRVGGDGGIVVYTIKQSGDELRLEGKWSAFGSDGTVLDETLTKR